MSSIRLRGERSRFAIIVLLALVQQVNGQNNNPVSGGIQGVVKDPKGQGIKNALITIIDSEGKVYDKTRTFPDGGFSDAAMMPGIYRVKVDEGLDEDIAYVEVGKLFKFSYPKVLTVGLTTVIGTIPGPGGRGVTVYVVGAPDLRATTDADGGFRIKYVPPGVHTINAQVPGIICRVNIDESGPHEVKVRSCGRGQGSSTSHIHPMNSYGTGIRPYPFKSVFANFHSTKTTIIGSNQFWLPPFSSFSSGGVEVRGIVLGAGDKPLESASITLGDERNENFYATATNARGEYIFSDVPAGNYTIEASKTGYSDATGIIKIEVIDRPDIPKSAGAKITGDLKLRLDLLPTRVPHGQTLPALTNQPTTPSGRSILVQVSDVGRNNNFGELLWSALPLGGMTDMRTFDELSLLVPGVAPPPYTPGVRGPGVGFGVGTAGKFSVNGMRARSNNFTVDGSDDNDPDVGVRRQGFIALVPQSVESITQMQIRTALWDAELGRNFGSQVNAVTKRGGNEIHGQAYGYFTDSHLNARNFFDYVHDKDPYTRTMAGFVLGGPLQRNRTHCFGSYEHVAVSTSTEQHFATPALSDRSFLGRRSIGILDPLPEGIPNSLFRTRQGQSPLGSNILSFYPEPNDPGGPFGNNTYTAILPASGAGDIASMKITRSAAENGVLNARYNFTNDQRTLPSANRAISSSLDVDTRTQNLSLIYERKLRSNLSGQFRFSYGRTRLNFSGRSDSPLLFEHSSRASVSVFGEQEGMRDSRTALIGEVLIEPFSPVGVDTSTFPQRWVDNTFQYGGVLYRTMQRHMIKFGADIRRIQLNSRLERDYRPRVVYGSTVLDFGNIDEAASDGNVVVTFIPNGRQRLVSGIELANLGLPTSIFQTLTSGTPDPTIGLRFTENDLFFNDNWRVKPSISFDYGLHYNYTTVPHEVNERIERALRLQGLPTPGHSRADTPERTQAFNAAVDAYRQILDGRTGIYEPDRNNFGPHIGFVWAPGLDTRRVDFSIRAGYGIYYDTILGAVVSQSRNIFPTEIPLNVNPSFAGFDVFNLRSPASITVAINGNGAPIPLVGLGNQIGGSPKDFVALVGDVFLRNSGKGGLAFTLPAKKLRTPYAQQWHVTLDFQPSQNTVISAAYVGTKGTKLTRLTTPNFGPNITTFVPTAKKGSLFGSPLFPLPNLGFPPLLVLAKQAVSKIGVRPNGALGAYQIFENSASSNYSALQLEGRGRVFSDLTFSLAYTWSHAIDDVSDIFPVGGGPVVAQDSLNYRLDRGNASFDVRHRLAASLVWDIHAHRDKTGSNALWLSGWQVASIFQANTGQPFTLGVPLDANFDGNLTDRPSTTEGLTFLHGHGPRRIVVQPGRDVKDFFLFGQSGAVGRNTARGDSFVNWDLAINKSFKLSNNDKLELRTEFFNLANRANFGLPIRTIGAPGFGSSVDTINQARVIQFAVKFSF